MKIDTRPTAVAFWYGYKNGGLKITYKRLQLLRMLSDGYMTARQVADETGVRKKNTKSQLDWLHMKGLLNRWRHSEGRRPHCYSLSHPLGTDVLFAAKAWDKHKELALQADEAVSSGDGYGGYTIFRHPDTKRVKTLNVSTFRTALEGL